ncbi:MAG: methyltransferase domain-containing protein [Thermoplasmata archaeon]|nr:methyltransferase domain-containing protein [Thermoplasmata archaeon]
MTWKYSDEAYTEYTRTTWNESAAHYDSWARNLSPYRRDVLRSVAPRPGEEFLDLATGPGEPALSIAQRVGPRGRVVGVDISREMIAIARRSARESGVGHARFLTMDCSHLRFPDASFDAVVSCFGFQIFTDPQRVALESRRVLRKGGRIALSLWGPPERTPSVNAIIGPMMRFAEPDEAGYLPSTFEMGAPGQLSAFLRAAGFRNPRERRVSHLSFYRDADDYLESIQRSTPIGHSLSEEPARVRARVQRETRANLRGWTTQRGIEIPGEAVIGTARA